MSKAPRAAFQRLDQRVRPLPVGSRLQMVRYNTFNADCSVGKWSRALTARRNRALMDSIALVPAAATVGATVAGLYAIAAALWHGVPNSPFLRATLLAAI